MKEPGAFDSAEECFEYAEPVNQNLICSICYAPFLEPITVSCQHTFCLHCFSNHLSSSTTQEQDPLRQKEPKCPLCNTAIDLHWTQSKIVSLMCEELSVYCSNRKKGCSWTGERQLMANHREKTCDYSVRSCTSAGCSFVGAELSKHLLICDFVLAECNHCGLELSRKELESHSSAEIMCEYCRNEFPVCKLAIHQSLVCPYTMINCNQSSFGCGWAGERQMLEDHLESCAYEAIKGFLVLNLKTIQDLQEENSNLKQRVTRLEAKLQDSNQSANQIILMDNIGRDFSIIRNDMDALVLEFGQTELKREGEHIRLLDEIHSLRMLCQSFQAQLTEFSRNGRTSASTKPSAKLPASGTPTKL